MKRSQRSGRIGKTGGNGAVLPGGNTLCPFAHIAEEYSRPVYSSRREEARVGIFPSENKFRKTNSLTHIEIMFFFYLTKPSLLSLVSKFYGVSSLSPAGIFDSAHLILYGPSVPKKIDVRKIETFIKKNTYPNFPCGPTAHGKLGVLHPALFQQGGCQKYCVTVSYPLITKINEKYPKSN
jgi:hypothetical protein